MFLETVWSQRSDNGIRKHGTYQNASSAQCSRDDNLRSISLNIHLLIFDEPENRRREASVAWKGIKDINCHQFWLPKEQKNWEEILSIVFFKNNKAENTDVFFKYGAIRAAEWDYFCARKSENPVRNFEIGVQSAFKYLALPRHFTSHRLPTVGRTQHSSGSLGDPRDLIIRIWRIKIELKLSHSPEDSHIFRTIHW